MPPLSLRSHLRGGPLFADHTAPFSCITDTCITQHTDERMAAAEQRAATRDAETRAVAQAALQMAVQARDAATAAREEASAAREEATAAREEAREGFEAASREAGSLNDKPWMPSRPSATGSPCTVRP